MNSRTTILFGGGAVVAAASIAAMAAWAARTPSAPSTPAISPAGPAASAEADGKTYTIDPVHTSVVFKIKHMNTSNFYGRFNRSSGSFTLGETFSADVTIPTESVDTNNSKRDSDIKAAEYLGARDFPEIKFVAKNLAKSGDGWKGKADLTFHGQTKPIDVEIHQTGAGKSPMGGKEIAGIETMFTIKRSEFGSKGGMGGVGDDVTLIVASEGGVK